MLLYFYVPVWPVCPNEIEKNNIMLKRHMQIQEDFKKRKFVCLPHLYEPLLFIFYLLPIKLVLYLPITNYQ